MLQFPTQLKFWIVPAIVASLSIVGFLLEPDASQALAFSRLHVEAFEFWRLITGHLLHTNAAHLALNLLGFALLWALHGEYYTPKKIALFLLLSSVMTSVAIYYFSTQIVWYVGLSGILHGLFVWGACLDVVKKDRTGWLLLIGVAIKIAYEQFGGSTQDIAELIGASVAVDAHLYGALSGLILAVGFISIQHRQPTQEHDSVPPE